MLKFRPTVVSRSSLSHQNETVTYIAAPATWPCLLIFLFCIHSFPFNSFVFIIMCVYNGVNIFYFRLLISHSFCIFYICVCLFYFFFCYFVFLLYIWLFHKICLRCSACSGTVEDIHYENLDMRNTSTDSLHFVMFDRYKHHACWSPFSRSCNQSPSLFLHQELPWTLWWTTPRCRLAINQTCWSHEPCAWLTSY